MATDKYKEMTAEKYRAFVHSSYNSESEQAAIFIEALADCEKQRKEYEALFRNGIRSYLGIAPNALPRLIKEKWKEQYTEKFKQEIERLKKIEQDQKDKKAKASINSEEVPSHPNGLKADGLMVLPPGWEEVERRYYENELNRELTNDEQMNVLFYQILPEISKPTRDELTGYWELYHERLYFRNILLRHEKDLINWGRFQQTKKEKRLGVNKTRPIIWEGSKQDLVQCFTALSKSKYLFSEQLRRFNTEIAPHFKIGSKEWTCPEKLKAIQFRGGVYDVCGFFEVLFENELIKSSTHKRMASIISAHFTNEEGKKFIRTSIKSMKNQADGDSTYSKRTEKMRKILFGINGKPR